MNKVFIYGAFQDGTRNSRFCKDINFGDLTIYRTMKKALDKEFFTVDFVLPDEKEKIISLCEDDYLVIGGGGLIHPSLLNVSVISDCKAKKAVFGIGINWENDTKYKVIKSLRESCRILKDIPFVYVRDYQTKDFLNMSHAVVCPDVILSNWVGNVSSGIEKAVVVTDVLFPRLDEMPIYFNSLHLRADTKSIYDISCLTRFGRIRSRNYHGMLLAFVVNAVSDVYVHNVKHDAFLRSYADKLDIQYNNEITTIRCKDPKWLCDESNKGLNALVRFLKQ